MEKKVWEGMERQDIDSDVAACGGDAEHTDSAHLHFLGGSIVFHLAGGI